MPEFIPLPFSRYSYDPDFAKLTPELTASPPYDVLSKKDREHQISLSPYNITRIDLPGDYAEAGGLLASWRHRGILVRDRTTYQIMSETFPLAGGELTRWTVFGGLRLGPWGESGIYPHEKTYPKAKTDRLNLMRATRAQLSPILAVCDSPELDLAALGDLASDTSPPLLGYTGDDGVRRSLWRVPASEEAKVAAALASTPVYVADGHHRFETALAYQGEAGPGSAQAPAPWDYVFTGIANVAFPGVAVLPYHRLLTRHTDHDLPGALEKARAHFAVTPGATLADLAACPDPAAFLLATAGGTWLLAAKSPPASTGTATGTPGDLFAQIGAHVFDHRFCEDCLSLTPADLASGAHLGHTPFAEKALETVASGKAQAAALVKPVSMRLIRDISHAGLTMPRKSTYFHPKLPTGLQMYIFE